MEIKILGTGCPSCLKLEEQAKRAVEASGRNDVEIVHVKDIATITEYGVMATPAIVVNEEVKASGRIPEVEEIQRWLV